MRSKQDNWQGREGGARKRGKELGSDEHNGLEKTRKKSGLGIKPEEITEADSVVWAYIYSCAQTKEL